MRSTAICLLLMALLSLSVALADPLIVSSPARVLDGDTVVIKNGDTSSFRDGVHVRLKGVDAAERGTPRGDDASQIMLGIVNGSDLTCHLTGEKTYRRDVGFCFTADGTDINRAIIEMGAALACPRSTRYVGVEHVEALAVQARSSYCVIRRGK